MINIGDTIYIKFSNEIYQTSVYMKGRVSFIHKDAFNEHLIVAYRYPLRYDEEGIRWFRNLDNFDNLKKVEDGYWVIQDDA